MSIDRIGWDMIPLDTAPGSLLLFETNFSFSAFGNSPFYWVSKRFDIFVKKC